MLERAAHVGRYKLSSCLPSPSCRVNLLAARVEGRLRVHEQGDNETVQTQDFGENENENHADEKTRLLSSSSYTSITDNTDSETGSKTSKTNRETGTELDEASVEREILLQTIGDKDRDDETVNTNDTSHNDGNNVLDDQIGAENTHGSNTDAGLGGTVGGTEASEDDGAGAAHGTKEGRIDGAVFGDHFDGIERSRQIIMCLPEESKLGREENCGEAGGKAGC